MSRLYLLDTNALSEPLRPVPDEGVMRLLKKYQGAIATAAPVWHELLAGYRRLPVSKRRDRIERYLHDVVEPHVPVLPYDASAADWHAAERARLTSAGKTPPFIDGMIAAIANINGLRLVTANVSDYRFFQGLTVEDWRERRK